MENDYHVFPGEIKSHILQSRYMATAAVNREWIRLYFQSSYLQNLKRTTPGYKGMLPNSNELKKILDDDNQ